MENIPVLYVFFNFLAVCYLMTFNTVFRKVKESPTEATIDILTILTAFCVPFLASMVYIVFVSLLNNPGPEDAFPLVISGFYAFQIARAMLFRAKRKNA